MRYLVAFLSFLFVATPTFADPLIVDLKCSGTAALDQFDVLAFDTELSFLFARKYRLIHFRTDVANNGFHRVVEHAWGADSGEFFAPEGEHRVTQLRGERQGRLVSHAWLGDIGTALDPEGAIEIQVEGASPEHYALKCRLK